MNLQKFARMRLSGKESLVECAAKPLQKKMMVSEIELQHAESVHTLELNRIPEFMPQFLDEQ